MLEIAPWEVLARSALEGPAAHHRRVGGLLDDLHQLLPADLADRVGLSSATHPLHLVRADVLRRAGAALAACDLVDAAMGLPGAADGVVLRTEPLDEALFRAVARSPNGGVGVRVVPALPYRVLPVRERLYRAERWARGFGAGRAAPQPRWSAVAVAQHPGHLEELATLAVVLAEQGIDLGLVAFDARVARAADSVGLSHRVLRASRRDHLRAVRSTQGVRAAVRAAIASPHLALGRSRLAFADAVDRSLATHLPWLLRAGDELAREVSAADVVVLAIPYIESGRLAGGLARAASVPVVALQHGTVFRSDPRWEHLPIDLICAWGDPSVDALRSGGVPADRIVVTGAAKYDTPALASALGAPTMRAAGGPREVLVASSGPGDPVSVAQHQLFVLALAEAVERTPDVQWTVKLHPKDDPAFYRAIPSRVRVVPADHSSLSILDHLATSDVLVTCVSMTAVDAVAMGVPVVLFEVKGSAYAHDEAFLAEAATAVVSSAEGLEEAVRIVEGVRPAVDGYRARHFAHQGEAARRIAEVITSTARRRG